MIELLPLKKVEDERGFLVNLPPGILEQVKHSFFATIAPGTSRGNHYHKLKTEWVLVTLGICKVILTDVKTNKVETVDLNAEDPKLLTIPKNVQVSIKNDTMEPVSIIAFFDFPFDPDQPDVWTI